MTWNYGVYTPSPPNITSNGYSYIADGESDYSRNMRLLERKAAYIKINFPWWENEDYKIKAYCQSIESVLLLNVKDYTNCIRKVLKNKKIKKTDVLGLKENVLDNLRNDPEFNSKIKSLDNLIKQARQYKEL